MTDAVIRRALISVSDKTGLLDFARALAARGIELLSTGGTAKALQAAGIPVKDVSEHTGFPEMMDGRVKTLHPKIHGAFLALRDNPDHVASMNKHGIEPIDLVVVNLYPFEQAIAKKGVTLGEAIENIDIGGPAMIRSAAKNHGDVTVVTDPGEYPELIAALQVNGGATTFEYRQALAAKAFARTAAYDAAIAGWFAESLAIEAPVHRTLAGRLKQKLRYGENPHQQAALYGTGEMRPGVATAEQIQGKELSYNNINDTDAAFELICELAAEKPAIAIIKHANPSGVAAAATLAEAYRLALRTDPVSAFGGIVAANRPLDAETAGEIAKLFAEVIIAPGISDEARKVLAAKANLRVLVTSGLADPAATAMLVKPVAGGFLVQSRDNGRIEPAMLRLVTKRAPAPHEITDMIFAFQVAKHVKSNAIVYAKDGATVGIGAGQMSRIDSTRIAAMKAEDAAHAAGLPQSLAKGSVVASDAFFPFADGLVAAAEAGATAVIQPGGSIRDDEVIAAADARGLAMVFTGIRHFRH